MHAPQRIFVPAQRLQPVFAALSARLSGGTCRLGLSRALPILALSDLKCLDLAVLGSGWRMRTPYVYPLLASGPNSAFPEAKGRPLEWAAEADWVFLGGNPDDFACAVRDAALALRRQEVNLIPYAAVKGPLPQKSRPGDTHVHLRKMWHFVNHISVRTVMDQLLNLPEERWSETGYAAVQDHIGVFRPHIERHLKKSPALVLDLGCGLGQTTRSLAELFPDARVVGLDVSLDSLAVARQKFDRPNLEFRPFDFANRFAFDDGSVDLIVSSSALNISENQVRTAAETFRVLAADGLLVNGCIFEPFHTYFDFPQSAFRLTRSNLLLHDWRKAAVRKGFGLALTHWTRANSRHYFSSRSLGVFDPLYRVWQDEIVHDPFTPYDYPQCTAVMSAGASIARDDSLRVPPANHLEALEDILTAYLRASPAVREISEINWLTQFTLAGLVPEALDYLAACLPGAADILAYALPKEIVRSAATQAA